MNNLHSSHYPSIVFFGTPDFAAYILEDLLAKQIPVQGVVTAPDKPAGRGRKVSASPVKKTAQKYNIPVLQPSNLKDPAFLKELKKLDPQIQIVIAFRMLPEQVWALPPMGTVNLHASLLPQYRGAAPIQWALLNGEKVTGVTTFFINQNIDTGKIILQQQVPIEPDENAGTLSEKLMIAGAGIIRETIDNIIQGTVKPIDQSQFVSEPLKKAPKIKKENLFIDWRRTPEQICNQIRAFSPSPGAMTKIKIADQKEMFLKIFHATPIIAHHHHQIPSFVSDNKTTLEVAVHDGYIRIFELQLEGRKRMPVEEFLKGFNPDKAVITG